MPKKVMPYKFFLSFAEASGLNPKDPHMKELYKYLLEVLPGIKKIEEISPKHPWLQKEAPELQKAQQSLEEARQLAVLAEDLALPVMVSMNRRFDPALQAGLDWMGGRHLVYVRATQARVARREPEFITDTAIHALDALRFIAGEVGSWRVQSRQVAGVSWYAVSMEFENGTAGSLEILPDAGSVVELYELFGDGFHLQIRAGGVDAGEVIAWESGTLVLNSKPGGDEPEYVANGCLAETTAFLENLIEGRPLQPTPGQVLGSVELCHHIKSNVAKEC